MVEPVTIRVAYGWSGDDARKDDRWQGMRKFLTGIVATVDERHKHALTVAAADTKDFPLRIYGPERLRAMPGMILGESIFDRIAMTDILVADISYRDRGEGNRERPGNVLIEVGAALANRRTRVFLVSDDQSASAVSGLHHNISDLQGYYITKIGANDASNADERRDALNRNSSLRMAIQGAVIGLMRDRGVWPVVAETDLRGEAED